MSFDETVFITGFPGFIAGRLIERLAIDGARLLLLVQPALLERARQDLERITQRQNIPANAFRILPGDITAENLGLSPRDLETARHETNTIFHLAALYDLGVTRERGLEINVGGTKQVNTFARSLRNLRRYHYVSTCYVAGRRKGLILETELKHQAGFRNFYEESKHLAELEVEALKAELPVTIHRPAVVCGDSQTGETEKYDGIYYLIHYLLKMPRFVSWLNIGNRQVSLNLVPIDFVVAAMIALAQDDQAIGKTLQLADHRPLTTHALFNEIAREVNQSGSRLTIPARVVEFTLMLPPSPPITGLPHPAVPYFFLKQSYDTTQSKALLDTHGVACPPFSSYVRNIVDFATKHPQL